MKKIVIAGLYLDNINDNEKQFDESKGLAIACGYEIVGEMIQRRRTPHPATFFGEGKIYEIKDLIVETKAEACMISSSITPSQMRTLKEILGVRVFDRNDCILDIFGQRAHTKQAKLQVELATLKHELPFVIHTQQNFSRMRGGNKNKGEGEKQYQLDQRKYEIQIQQVEKKLKEVKKSLSTMKRKRQNSDLKLVSLVGYTNAGKSTCMNQILRLCQVSQDKEVFVKDMLFATLDTSIRKVSYKGVDFLLSDTVGFISHLPHELVDAFHSTLESVCDADLILQVVDESSEDKQEHMRVTLDTLKKLQAEQIPLWTLHNKCDLAEYKRNEKGHFYISAVQSKGLEEVLEAIIEEIKKEYQIITLNVKYDDYQLNSKVHRYAKILEIKEKEDHYEYKIEVKQKDINQFVNND
ncbi:MAG: GTPase HflX [Traorella sp.]